MGEDLTATQLALLRFLAGGTPQPPVHRRPATYHVLVQRGLIVRRGRGTFQATSAGEVLLQRTEQADQSRP